MAKHSSSSVLLLELEDLKEHMSRVQAEVGRCVTSLTVHRDEVCEVLARLETVTAIVRAVETVDRNKTVEKVVSDPCPVQKIVADFDRCKLGAAVSKESYCAFREGEQYFATLGSTNEKKIDQKSDVIFRNKEASQLNRNSPSFTPASLANVMTFEITENGFLASGKVDLRNEAKNVEEVDSVRNINSDDQKSVDNVLRSTRPSLSRKGRKIVGEKIKATEDDIKITITSDTTTVATKSVQSFIVPSNLKMSSPSSVTSGKTCSSSMVNSTSSMVNRVKETCRKQGWKVEGCYSTREGKEGCGMVHFYKLEVKGGAKSLLTRGVGVSKVEAVRRAFKTMEDRLIDGDIELVRNVESVKLKKQEDLCDNKVNFPEGEILSAVKSESGSEDSLSPPPLFHAKDCVAADFKRVKKSKDPIKTVHRTLTVSDGDAGAIIGKDGDRITSIRREADVSILVEDCVEGRQGRLVKMWGMKASVDKAQKMIKEIIEK